MSSASWMILGTSALVGAVGAGAFATLFLRLDRRMRECLICVVELVQSNHERIRAVEQRLQGCNRDYEGGDFGDRNCEQRN